jgi:hypothetical protein
MVPLLPSSVAWSGLVRIRPRWKAVTLPLPWHTSEVADTVFSIPDDECVTPETCRVTWQWINVCILLHRVGPLLTMNHDARNHVFKIYPFLGEKCCWRRICILRNLVRAYCWSSVPSYLAYTRITIICVNIREVVHNIVNFIARICFWKKKIYLFHKIPVFSCRYIFNVSSKIKNL